MGTDRFIKELRDLLIEGELDSGVAGVNHESGALGLDVAMQDGSEFHIEVTKQ